MRLLALFAFLLSTTVYAQAKTPYWMSQKYQASLKYLLKNIDPESKHPGTVIASPSKQRPNYYFHWVRDAALVMNSIVDLYLIDSGNARRNQWERLLIRYAIRARIHQKANALTGLGEPKFNLDGTGFDGPWGRPQYDGAALRAAVFTRLAAVWLQSGRKDLVFKYLWNPKKPKDSLIKTDLDFTLKVWNKPSFDLWEESKGIHFFTMLAQRKALKLGAKLALALGQQKAAVRYGNAYSGLSKAMESFWSPFRGMYLSTLKRTGGVDYKKSNLDSSIFIAVNFAEITDNSVGRLDDSRLIRTFHLQEQMFGDLYPINFRKKNLPPVIGRYPEDRYNGVNNSIGNPWFITTHAFGEYLYKLASYIKLRRVIRVDAMSFDFYKSLGVEVQKDEKIKFKDKRFKEILAAIFKRADGYLATAQQHTASGYRMAEQINRQNGYQQGAGDLTWSYASYISSYFARHRFYQVLSVNKK